jgi:hypothetical protein
VSQFGFVGPAYQAANPYQDNQACVNWYVEVDPNEPNPNQPNMETPEAKVGARSCWVFRACPLSVRSTAARFAVAGCLPGNSQAIFVVGSERGSGVGDWFWALRRRSRSPRIGDDGDQRGVVNIRDNGAGKIVVIVDGTTSLYVYNITSGVFSTFAGANYLGATNVVELDGWFVFNQPGTQKFFTSPNYWNGTSDLTGRTSP